jgi:hypothetical protein
MQVTTSDDSVASTAGNASNGQHAAPATPLQAHAAGRRLHGASSASDLQPQIWLFYSGGSSTRLLPAAHSADGGRRLQGAEQHVIVSLGQKQYDFALPTVWATRAHAGPGRRLLQLSYDGSRPYIVVVRCHILLLHAEAEED